MLLCFYGIMFMLLMVYQFNRYYNTLIGTLIIWLSYVPGLIHQIISLKVREG